MALAHTRNGHVWAKAMVTRLRGQLAHLAQVAQQGVMHAREIAWIVVQLDRLCSWAA
jgi:hypothetical protein